MEVTAFTSALKDEARRLGFALAGACPAVTPQGIHHFHAWLEAGYAGEMTYLLERRDAYEHPRHILDGARSLLLLAIPYRTCDPAAAGASQGRVSRYAWGTDYHDLIHDRLRRLADWLKAQVPTSKARGVVDTAPLLEREFAQLAGLGWIGKNTLLLNKRLGSWFFLAALLTDVELAYDAPHEADHCGTCRACLDACPTQAFVAPYVLDSRRCISYLTIELRGPIATELQTGVGDWLFGCDICQEVCPWNHFAPTSDERAFVPAPDTNPLDLPALFDLDDDAFRQRFRHAPLWRPKRRGLLRNAAIVLGNKRPPEGVGALTRGLADKEPLVRGACAWALRQYDAATAREVLQARLTTETDPEVRRELLGARPVG
jgi:epoxyqueuosine reductase